MSGYLQRLAATVTTRTPAIHPIPSSPIASPVFTPSAAVESSSISPSGRERSTTGAPFGSPLPAESEPIQHLEYADRSSEHSLQPIAAFHPLMEPSLAEEAGEPSRASASRSIRPQSALSEGDSRGFSESPLAASSSRRESVGSTHSLDPSSEQSSDPSHALTPSLLPVSMEHPRETHLRSNVAGRTLPETQLRRAAQLSRGPDDIQIHIGRIEVLAVPPPAARPAAPPPRKSVSLDEYLRRSERRPR